MFSSRLPATLAANAISGRVAALRAEGVELLDLTQSNPTTVGLHYPDILTGVLADAEGLTYRPEPLGSLAAREAVAREYARHGRDVRSDRVVLTASTSEAYAVLFKLLCDPGDDVLVPQPGYPLFDSLTRLDAVGARPYKLEFHGRWSIDRESVVAAASSRTRAVLVVSPNNPTGSMLRQADRDWLADLAAASGWALISDEVFGDYPLRPGQDSASLLGEARALTFVLGGLSKSVGLPQLKLAWTLASGPSELVTAALSRLEVICDSYLSVSTPVQLALSVLLSEGRHVREAIRRRLLGNLKTLERLSEGSPLSAMAPEGGWSAVVRVPETGTEEALVLRLLNEGHVLVHPGYFFDFERGAHLVLSLLPEPEVFEEGVRRIVRTVKNGVEL